MDKLEQRMETLEKQAAHNLIYGLLTGVELHIYKAEICRGRWGSPGGNDIGYLELQEARRLLDRIAWPAQLQEAAQRLDERIAIYAGYLKEKDITMVSLEDTRMKEAYKDLHEKVLALLV